MRTRKMLVVVSLVVLILFLGAGQVLAQDADPEAPQAALGTAFTYQGQLKDGSGNPIDASCTFKFGLFSDSGGSTRVSGTTDQVVGPLTVTNGYFTASMDFGGSAFNGQERWLKVSLMCGSDVSYADLSPLQKLTAAPYASYAMASGSVPWSGVSGTPPQLPTGCTSGYIPEWNGSQWVCGVDDVGTGGGGGDITAVNAGTGLSGGGGSGDVTLNLGTAYRLPQSCSNGALPKWNTSTSLWECGSDANTTYSAGNGLILSGTSFSVNFASTGSANTAARSDHDHWGASWTGSGTGLALSGGEIGLSGSGSTYGVMGQSDTSGGKGLYGYASATAGFSTGVKGETESSEGSGVSGINNSSGTGVFGFVLGTSGYGVWGLSNATSGDTYGVVGSADSPDGTGVKGFANATSGWANGVIGQTNSSDGNGVIGISAAASGTTYGVSGSSASSSGSGVYGYASATSGITYGVLGSADSPSGTGVKGLANATSGETYGVYGQVNSSGGSGVYGLASATTGTAIGINGFSAAPSGMGVSGHAYATSGENYGVYGRSDSTAGYGVVGYAGAASGITYGVLGSANSPSGTGVKGLAYATSGSTYGVYGQSYSSQGIGVYGFASATTGSATGVNGFSAATLGIGVFGYAYATSGENYGVYGRSDSTAGYGVVGYASKTSGTTYGVLGSADSVMGTGVQGLANATSGNTYGVYGKSYSTAGYGVVGVANATSGTTYGVYGEVNSTSGYAGYFSGKVHVNGTLTKTAGSFKIDNPLNPANQYLYHSFVESPDMKNIYDGMVTLDARGEAWVQMPDWFEALNGSSPLDYRYQLTCIGGYAPVYVAQEMQGNRFMVAGGTPGLRVSWQVTGIRHDPYAEANRIPVVVDKPADEQGTYLYPELYGQPESAGLDYQRQVDRGMEQR